MTPRLKIFGAGLLISFLGSLPLGTMNIAATHIAAKNGTNAALVYAVGSMIAELAYVRVILMAMHWVSKQHKLFRMLEWITILIILALAAGSFIAAINMTGFNSAFTAEVKYPFLWGLLLSVTNPLHIPFWLGWTSVLVNKKILVPGVANRYGYMAGIGAGTIAGFMVFIFGGSYLTAQLKAHQDVLNWAVGIILLLTALIQLYKTINFSSATKYQNG